MTRDEFTSWVEAHYTKLIYATMKKFGCSEADAQDSVQQALTTAYATENYKRCHTNPLTWFLYSVKSANKNRRRSRGRINTVRGELAILEGPDTGNYRGITEVRKHQARWGYKDASE